jgi:hypothetical protein
MVEECEYGITGATFVTNGKETMFSQTGVWISDGSTLCQRCGSPGNPDLFCDKNRMKECCFFKPKKRRC